MSFGILEIMIVALIFLLVLALFGGLFFLVLRVIRMVPSSPSGGLKKCPYCAEYIKKEALVCRYCGRDQPPLNG